MRFKRPCKECEELFKPEKKFATICDSCFRKKYLEGYRKRFPNLQSKSREKGG